MNKINENSRQQLTKIGFSDREINIMELSPRMVRLINEYKGEFKIRDDGLSGAYYSKGEIPEDDKIAFSNEYRKISTIAHELGHATREYQHPAYPKDYDTAQAYSEAYMLEEGKAYYIECKVMLELRRAGVNLLDIDPSLKTKDGEQVVIDGGIWEDNEIYSSQLSSYSKQIGKTYSKEIEDIVNNNDEGKSAFEKISKINAIMIPSGQDIKKEGKNDNSWGSLVPTPDDPPQLTYDEKNKWNYLAENVYKKSNLGDLKEDYKNVMGKELKKNSFHVKSLMNKANNFYGENGNDWISKQIGITPLAEWSKQGDLLYGGKGDDIIIGNSGRDILIGGDDNDTLSGESGDDILGGNNGKDTLYGGIGDDAYVADYEDTIYDSDGVGKVFLDGDINSQQLFGGVRRNGQDFYDDGTHEYLWSGNGSDLIIRRKGEKGQNGLKIEKFENKQLGITLREEGELPPSEPPPTSQRPKDPLSLDLDRNGKIDTLPRSAGVHFDLDNSGFAEQTSWLAPGDGFLVLDRNNNGHIDGGAELFGSETTLNSGKVAENGFEALAEWDSNTDGKITAEDAIYHRLCIWQDKNSNGIVNSGELNTLQAHGVAEIHLDYKEGFLNDWNNVRHREIGHFIRADGTSGELHTLWFDNNTIHSVPVDIQQGKTIEISAEIAALPDAKGFGNIYSLHHAMALDTSGTLQKLVTQFVQEKNPASRHALTDKIMARWAGKEDITPGSRGELVDARHLALLEAFWGTVVDKENPNQWRADWLKLAYKQLHNMVYRQLAGQTHYKTLYGVVDFYKDKNIWRANMAKVNQQLLQAFVSGMMSAEEIHDFLINTVGGSVIDNETLLHDIKQSIINDAKMLPDTKMNSLLNVVMHDDDIITGNDEDNHIATYGGDDEVKGMAGNDTINTGSGNDKAYGGLGNDTLYGGDGDDHLEGGKGNDVVNGGDGNDTIEDDGSDNADDDVFNGDAGNDTIISASGNDILNGGEGNDYLSGGYYASTKHTIMNGGSGNDTLISGRGSNTFIFGRNFGKDYISSNLIAPVHYSKSIQSVNTIRFDDDQKLSDFIFRRKYDSLIISARESDDEIIISDQFIDHQWNTLSKHTQYHIDRIIFSDGTELDHAAIVKLIRQGTEGDDKLYAADDGNTLSGMAGNDVLYGGVGADVLDGGAGNDTLIGDDGDDILDGGEGDDILSGWDGADVYIFKGSWGKDIIYDDQSENRIHLEDCSLEDIRFSRINGKDLLVRKLGTENEILIQAQFSDEGVLDACSITQWEFADGRVLSSTEVNKLLHQGTDGDDVMEGDAYDNILAGKAGNDSLHGNDGNDEIDGGDGDDHLHGDGGDDRLDGGNGNDTLDGGDGADILAGGKGDDSYIIGDNDTVILGESMGSDHLHIAKGKYAPLKNVTIQLDIPITPEQVQVIRKDFNDAVTGADDYSLFNPEMPLSTPKGTLKDTFSEIRYMLSAHLPSLEKGRDYLVGSLGDAQDWKLPKDRAFVLNVDRGIPFDNAFSQWTRQDQYYLKFDTVSKHYFTITPKPGISDDLLLNFGNAGKLTIDNGLSRNLYGDITLSFKNGSKMSISELLQRQLDAAQTDGNDMIRGFAGNDYLRGGAGNDILQGGEGDDSLEGGVGDDILSGGYYSLYWNTPESIYKGHYQYQYQASKSDRNLISGPDKYSSTPSPGLGNDTYIFSGAFGHDTVIDCDETKGNIDTLWFKDIASLEELNFRKVENNLVIATKDNRSSVTVINQFSKEQPHWGVESIQLGNGQAMKLDDVFLAPLMTKGSEHDDVLVNTSNQDIRIDGYAGNDTITSGTGNDTINGGDGNDTIDAGGGDDIIDGGNGDDSIDGGAGNDIITGGSGNDNMTGGDGDDEFIFSKGWGQDYIWSTWTRDLSNDVIRFTDVTPDEISLRQQMGNIILSRKGSNDFISLRGNTGIISKVIFADGSEWDTTKLLELSLSSTEDADTIETDSPDVTIHGGGGDDVIIARNGTNNRLYGDTGNDTISGNGELYGGDGNDKLFGIGKLYGEAGDDSLRGGSALYGGDGNDFLFLYRKEPGDTRPLYGDGGDGDDILRTSGDPSAYGEGVGTVAPSKGESVVTLRGGKGNDTIYGSYDNEVYEFSLGDGHDVIIESEAGLEWYYSNLKASWDVLRFGSDIKAGDIRYLRQGRDLLIRHKNGTDSITVQNFFYTENAAYHHYRINEVQFADGTTHTDSDIDRFVTQGSHQGNNKNSKMAANVADFSGGQHSRPMANNVAPAGVSADVIDQTALHHAQNLVQAMSTFDQRGINTNSLNGPDDSNLVNKMPLAPSL